MRFPGNLVASDASLNTRLIALARRLEELPLTPSIGVTACDARAPLRPDAIEEPRLALLAERLQEREATVELDGEDAVLLRLLLRDYESGVARVRAFAHALDEQLQQVESAIKEGRRAVKIARPQMASRKDDYES